MIEVELYFEFCGRAYSEECPHKDDPRFINHRRVANGFNIANMTEANITIEDMDYVNSVCRECNWFITEY